MCAFFKEHSKLAWEVLPDIISGLNSGRTRSLKMTSLSILSSFTVTKATNEQFNTLFELLANQLAQHFEEKNQDSTSLTILETIKELSTIINNYKHQENIDKKKFEYYQDVITDKQQNSFTGKSSNN